MKFLFARMPAGRFVPQLRGAKAALLACACIALAALGVGARAWQQTSITPPGERSAAAQATPQRDRVLSQVEAEIITVTPSGFEPGEITRPEGRFILMVENRSGLEEVRLQIQNEAGERVREAHVPRTELDWSDEIDLLPGRYVLIEASHPDWACQLTIAPR